MGRVTDVVCGMSIDPATAAGKSNYEGKDYYFCSAECKREFDANPAKYVSRPATADTVTHKDDPPFTKTGPLVAPKSGSAGSGGAEYEPLPGDVGD